MDMGSVPGLANAGQTYINILEIINRPLRMSSHCSDDLKLNPSLKGETLRNISKVAEGEKTTDIRAKLPARGLTVEQQVACLLNQATDANILGRTWVGWAPFM